MYNRSTFVCNRSRMAAYLLERGFLPYKVAPDKYNPRYNVYLYNASPELYVHVWDYIKIAKTYKKEGEGITKKWNEQTCNVTAYVG